MNRDDDIPFRDPDHEASMAELLADVSKQPIPARLRELAEQLAKALEEAHKRRDR
jgi:hypothetical protein